MSHCLIYPFVCIQDGSTALMVAAQQEETSCLSALIQAKTDINHQDRVMRLGADVGHVLIWGPHDAMSAHVLNVSLFGLPIRMHADWSHSLDDVCC